MAVRGAEPGDSLVAEILDVRPGRVGRRDAHPRLRAARPPRAGAADAAVRGARRGREDERAGVVPGEADGRRGRRRDRGETLATGHAGQHGGNLDDHWHGKGARIFFPVRQPGGMFAVGDMHAAMGDGEICFTGVEIAGEVDIRFDAAEGQAGDVAGDGARTIAGCRTRRRPTTPTRSQLVSEEAARLLVDEHGFTIEDAFIFLSVACDAGVAQACKPAEGFGTIARFSIPKIDACPGPFRASHSNESVPGT